MSITTLHTVFCDETPCTSWIAHEPSPAEARWLAKQHGWKRIRRGRQWVDLCPRHPH